MDAIYIQQLKELIEKGEYPQYLYKYRALNDMDIKAIERHQLWFSCGTAFNDPFEGRVSLAKSYSFVEMARYVFWQTAYLKDYDIYKVLDHEKMQNEIWYYVMHPEEWNRRLMQIIESDYSKMKICCLSAVCDNILMWSHYAKSHEGICLEFDLLKDLQAFSPIRKVKYVSQYRPMNYGLEMEELISQIIERKSHMWAYEQEYRVISRSTKDQYVVYHPQALRSIIFGCRTPEDKKQELMNKLRKDPNLRHIQFKRCILSKNSFGLDIIDL